MQLRQDYGVLRPTIAIWILEGVLFRETDRVHLRFRLSDDQLGLVFNDQIETLIAEAEWVCFLKEARRWTALPDTLHSPALRKAMDQLKTISQSQEDLALYRAREDYQRWELTKERERRQLDEELAAAREALEVAERQRQEALPREVQAERERQEALAREAQAEREHKRLRQRLRAAGIDPDA